MNDDQIQELQHAGRLAILTLAEWLIEREDEIVEMAVERCTTLGVEEYGDVSFHKPGERLECEVLEELADAVFYVWLWIRAREG